MNTPIWNQNNIKWIDIVNPTDEELIAYSNQFNLDLYTLSDCLEPAHLPKKEVFSDFTFIILRMYERKEEAYPSSIQQMSTKLAIFYGNDFILTIHRHALPIIEEIKEKYLEKDHIKETSAIVTKLMWYVVKSYEETAIELSEKIDAMEKQLFVGTHSKITLEELYYLKNTCRLTKKVMTLTKELIIHHETSLHDSSALQDVKDLLQKLLLSFEETHDDSTNLSNTYLSIVSQKTNEVMKLLTIFSVFFMPLTFIVGIYGMNFDHMPELRWQYGYPLILLLMTIIAVVIFIWFKRKRII